MVFTQEEKVVPRSRRGRVGLFAVFVFGKKPLPVVLDTEEVAPEVVPSAFSRCLCEVAASAADPLVMKTSSLALPSCQLKGWRAASADLSCAVCFLHEFACQK